MKLLDVLGENQLTLTDNKGVNRFEKNHDVAQEFMFLGWLFRRK